jgi:hypothetical protein
MLDKIEDKRLDDYLDGNLPEEDMIEFLEKVKVNRILSKELSLRLKIRKEIARSRKSHIQEYIKDNAFNGRKKVISMYSRIAIGMAACLLLGIIYLNIDRKNTDTEKIARSSQHNSTITLKSTDPDFIDSVNSWNQMGMDKSIKTRLSNTTNPNNPKLGKKVIQPKLKREVTNDVPGQIVEESPKEMVQKDLAIQSVASNEIDQSKSFEANPPKANTSMGAGAPNMSRNKSVNSISKSDIESGFNKVSIKYVIRDYKVQFNKTIDCYYKIDNNNLYKLTEDAVYIYIQDKSILENLILVNDNNKNFYLEINKKRIPIQKTSEYKSYKP